MGRVHDGLSSRRPLDGLAHGGLRLGAGNHVLGRSALGHSHHGLLGEGRG